VNTLISAIGFGIASGAVIALGALGFTLQFGLSNTLNIAYGGFITVAAFLGYGLIQLGLNPWVTMALTGLAVAALSVLYYRGLIRGLMRRGIGLGSIVIATVAAGIFIEYAVLAAAGPDVKSYGQTSGSTFHLGSVTLTSTQVAIIAVAAILMLVLHLLLRLTQLGKALRATAVNRTLARSCGIRTERVTLGAWLVSGLLCGVAGVALAMTTQSFDFTLGATFLISVIAAAVVGGIGQPYGAMLGGLIIGITTEVSAAYWSPAYSNVIAFGLLVAILLVRPVGLLGSQARRHEVAG
jgi:branched-chain amino acid transport system permease protein/neutral amino acid transport system permease protein